MNNEMKVFLNESLLKQDENQDVVVENIYKAMLKTSKDSINIDSDDIESLLQNQNNLFVGEGKSSSLSYAITLAFKSQLFKEMNFKQVKTLLVKFHINSDIPFMDICNSMNDISENINDESDMIFGTFCDDSISKDEMKVIVMATF